jgi:acetyl-CoA synthetase
MPKLAQPHTDNPAMPAPDFAYLPSPLAAASSNLARILRDWNCDSYAEFHAKTLANVASYWDWTLKDLGIVFDKPYSAVMSAGRRPEIPRWCDGGTANITASCLDRWRNTPTWHANAAVYESESGEVVCLTYADLARRVDAAAFYMTAQGLKSGDVIGLFAPMNLDCVIAFLAVMRIGAIVLPLFSGYGSSAITQRLQDSGAVALVVSPAVVRRGKPHDLLAVAHDALATLPAVTLLNANDFPAIAAKLAGHLAPHIGPADRPAMLIYTSGTTGKPKGAVHTHCGFPVKAAADMVQCMDVKRGDVVWWMTDIGWMMGPWLIFGTLIAGAAMVLYDGSPDTATADAAYPSHERIWHTAARHGVSLMGVSPTLIRSLMKSPDPAVDLPQLRAFASTGEPWTPSSWQWLFDNVGHGTRPIFNYSGGTEISGGIVCGHPLSPLRPCAFSGPMPGMDAAILDDSGQPCPVGNVGELVLRQPWIGMTRGFWRDEGDQRYLEAYWSRFPGVWCHGDFASVDTDGLWYIWGRSDDTIKVAGKRLGPAEVESVLTGHPAVAEAAALGVPDELKGQGLVCLVVVRPGHAADETLRSALARRIIDEMGKPLAPKAVHFASDLPKTRNGKVMRRLARAAYLGLPQGDLSAIENPGSLTAIAALQPAVPGGY